MWTKFKQKKRKRCPEHCQLPFFFPTLPMTSYFFAISISVFAFLFASNFSLASLAPPYYGESGALVPDLAYPGYFFFVQSNTNLEPNNCRPTGPNDQTATVNNCYLYNSSTLTGATYKVNCSQPNSFQVFPTGNCSGPSTFSAPSICYEARGQYYFAYCVYSNSPTSSPTYLPTQSPIPQACKPSNGINSRRCSKKISKCRKFGIKMKWSGVPCPPSSVGKKFGRSKKSGCQCDQYCGYSCSKACEHDRQCYWNVTAMKCYNNLTRLPGVPLPECH